MDNKPDDSTSAAQAHIIEIDRGLSELMILAAQLRDLSRDEREADRIYKEIEKLIG